MPGLTFSQTQPNAATDPAGGAASWLRNHLLLNRMWIADAVMNAVFFFLFFYAVGSAKSNTTDTHIEWSNLWCNGKGKVIW